MIGWYLIYSNNGLFPVLFNKDRENLNRVGKTGDIFG